MRGEKNIYISDFIWRKWIRIAFYTCGAETRSFWLKSGALTFVLAGEGEEAERAALCLL